MSKKNITILGLVLVELIFFMGPTAMASASPRGATAYYFGAANNLAVCPAQTTQICGVTVDLPETNINQIATVILPSPLVHHPLRVDCLVEPARSGSPFFQIVDSLPCEYQSCTQQTIEICHRPVPIFENLPLNARRTVEVPPNFLSPTAVNSKQSFTVSCLYQGGDRPLFEISDQGNVSCGDFLCPDTTLTFCQKSIFIPGGQSMGSTTDVKVDDLGVVEVQCIGSNGAEPKYQIIDTSQANCP